MEDTCILKDRGGKTHSIIINNLKENITKQEIKDFMNHMIDNELLMSVEKM